MTDKDRILLAEAMGWTNIDRAIHSGIITPRGFFQYERDWLPDPFTDANDDYAVLEWMRNGDKSRFSDFCDEIYVPVGRPWNYKTGDYARAAVAVLREQK